MATIPLVIRFKDGGTPTTGLSPTVTIRHIDGNVVENAAAMTEMSNGFYKYMFTGFNILSDYIYDFDGGSTLADSDRYLENYSGGIGGLIAQIPVGGGGAATRSVKLKKADIEKISSKLEQGIKDMFGTMELDFDMPLDEIKEVSKSISKATTDLQKEANQVLKTLENEQKKLVEKIETSQSHGDVDLATITSTITNLKSSMSSELIEFAKILKSVLKHQKDGLNKNSAEMLSLGKIMRTVIKINETKNKKIKDTLKQLI